MDTGTTSWVFISLESFIPAGYHLYNPKHHCEERKEKEQIITFGHISYL